MARQAGFGKSGLRKRWPWRAHCAAKCPLSLPRPIPPGSIPSPHPVRGKADESDTLYNTWLEREYYHNSETGENYWVSPSGNYSQTGPDDPGYYATYGNSLIKLTPGYAP